MGWDFETDEEFQQELDWIDNFVREEIEPLDFIVKSPYDLADPIRQEIIPPLQAKVQERGLWACHLGPELGGLGYGQVKLALMNEILGRARSAPTIFGCQAPDTGNSEILAHYGTDSQKERFLEPLLRNEIVSCYSMTEPQGGARSQGLPNPSRGRWRRVGNQRRKVVLLERSLRVVLDRDGRDRSGQPAVSATIDVPGAHRHSRRRDHPQCRPQLRGRVRRRRQPRLRPLHRRPSAPRRTCWDHEVVVSSSPRRASVAGASITPCAPRAGCNASST